MLDTREIIFTPLTRSQPPPADRLLQLVKHFAAANIPHLHICSMSSIFFQFSSLDMTLCSHIPSPFHAPFSNECSFHAYLIVFHPSLLAAPSLIILVPPFLSPRVTSGQIPPSFDTLLVPLYPLFILRLFPRLRSVHVYIRIDPHASNFSSTFRVTRLTLPPLFPQYSSAIHTSHVSLWL